MLKQEIELIKTAFSNYFADGKYWIIFLIALVFIVIEEKKKENKNFLVYYSMFMLLIIFNPIFCRIVLKFTTTGVYYRVLWLVPVGIVIAYFGTLLISKVDLKAKKIIVLLAFIGIIGYSGNFVYRHTTFEKVNNWYKLPDEYIQVTQILSQIPMDNKKVITSTDMIGYIRQLDASIHLAYPRRPYKDYDVYPIVTYYNTGDVQNLVELCQKSSTNIIVYDNSILLTISPSHYGYELYAQTEHYDIYVHTEESLCNFNIDEETLIIPGLKNHYKLCFINDLHIIVPDEDVSDENKETVQQRYDELFKTSIGERSEKLWTRLPSKINELNADLVVLGGDMVDYASKANIECLKSGMNQINQEIIYIRADHDYGLYYNPALTKEYLNNLEKSIDDNLEIYCKDLGEILVVGIDNSTSQISEQALLKLKEIFAIGKPIILVTHVPFNSKIDSTLAEESRKNWGDRNLTWDKEGTSYIADKQTKELFNLIEAQDSPVKAVLAAHLHFKNTSKLTKNITQYVFDATYKGNIGVVNLVGE